MTLKTQSEEGGGSGPLRDPQLEGIQRRRRLILIAALVAFALGCPVLVARMVPAAEAPPPADIYVTFTAPTGAPATTAASATLHYENRWLAFDHPAAFTAHEADDDSLAWHPPVDFGGEPLAFLGDPGFLKEGTYYRLIRISRIGACDCTDLGKVMDDHYAALDPRWILDESPMQEPALVDLGGNETLQKIYRIYWGEPAYDMRDVWLRRGGDVYIVSIYTRWTNADDLRLFQAAADGIMSSLVIK